MNYNKKLLTSYLIFLQHQEKYQCESKGKQSHTLDTENQIKSG